MADNAFGHIADWQVAHYRQEFLQLAQIDLIRAHLPEYGFLPATRPTLQIMLVNGPHRGRSQFKPARQLPRCCREDRIRRLQQSGLNNMRVVHILAQRQCFLAGKSRLARTVGSC